MKFTNGICLVVMFHLFRSANSCAFKCQLLSLIVDALVYLLFTKPLGRIETILSTAVVMDSFKKYFTYGRMICMCGIRNALFMGTRFDWVKLITKVTALKKYDVDGKLHSYVDQLGLFCTRF